MCMTSFTNFTLFLKLKKVIRPRKELLRQGGTEVGTCLSSASLHVIWEIQNLLFLYSVQKHFLVVFNIKVKLLNIFINTFVTFRCLGKQHCPFLYRFQTVIMRSTLHCKFSSLGKMARKNSTTKIFAGKAALAKIHTTSGYFSMFK